MPMPIAWALVVGIIAGVIAEILVPTSTNDTIPVGILGSIVVTVLAHRLFDHTGLDTSILGATIALCGWYALGEPRG